jgi:preprotein translocase subunit YajC
MDLCMAYWLVVAQGNGNPAQPGSLWPLFVPFLLILVLWHFLISRPQRREHARRDEMLKTLRKNDPVVTIGGIIGTVISVAEDGSEVTVKVDDNTRLKFRRDAIREVLRKEEPPKEAAKT